MPIFKSVRGKIPLLLLLHVFPGRSLAQIPTTIDILVIFSGNARLAAGGVGILETKILDAIRGANNAYTNSFASQRIRLVHMEETPFEFVDPGDMCASRDRIHSPADGYLDYAQNLRNQYGADIVVLVTNDAVPEFGAGCAFICGYDAPCNASFESNAFASVKWDYLDKDVLTHELGHIM
ncbi:MAG: zinc-dependent metalloprotease family protein [Fibrobacteria bacterium]